MKNITAVLALLLTAGAAQAAVIVDGDFQNNSLPSLTSINGNTQGIFYDVADGRFEREPPTVYPPTTEIDLGSGWAEFTQNLWDMTADAGPSGSGDFAPTLAAAAVNNINRGIVQFNQDSKATTGLQNLTLDFYSSNAGQELVLQVVGFNDNGTPAQAAPAVFGNGGFQLGSPAVGTFLVNQAINGNLADSIRGGDAYATGTWQTYTFADIDFGTGYDYYGIVVRRTANTGGGDDLRIDNIAVGGGGGTDDAEVTLTPGIQLAFTLDYPQNNATGTVAVSFDYGSSSNDVEVSSVVVTNQQHAGAFAVTPSSFTLTDPAPSNQLLDVTFDNTVAGLAANGATSTGLVAVTWNEAGSSSNNTEQVPVILTYSAPPAELNFADSSLELYAVDPATASTGSVAVSYIEATLSPTGIVITAVSFINASHPGAFGCLTVPPDLALNDPAPANETLAVQFDAAAGGLSAGETATADMVVIWNELGGASMTNELPVSGFYLPPSTGELLVNFQFNEAGHMSNAVERAGGNTLTWDYGDTDWALNGSGAAAISGTITEQTPGGTFVPITSGSVFMRVDYNAWTITDADGNGQSQFQPGMQFNNSIEVQSRLVLRDDSLTSYLGVDDNGSQTSFGNSYQLSPNGSDADGLSVILGVDMDNDTYSLWYSDTVGINKYVQQFNNVALNANVSSFVKPLMQVSQYLNDGDDVEIDMMLFGTNYNQIAAYSNAPPPVETNILLIILDDLNTDVEGYGGHPQTQTPNIDRLMDSGISFMQAHCTTPICAPSRSSFLTGIYPHTSGNFASDNWYTETALSNCYSIASYFKANGYYTIGTGKIMHNVRGSEWDEYYLWPDYGPFAYTGSSYSNSTSVAHPLVPSPYRDDYTGIDGSFGPLINIDGVDFGDENNYRWRSGSAYRGYRPIEYDATGTNRLDMTADELNAQWAVSNLTVLATNTLMQPFFMGVGFVRPHMPMIVDQRFFDQFPTNTLNLPVILADDIDDTFLGNTRNRQMYDSLVASYGGDREKALKLFVQAYLACVASVDESIGQILDVVDNSSLVSNTIVVVTSDHGWHNGQKDCLWKNTLWQQCTQVPLIMRVPGMTTPDTECDYPVSLIDLFPTLRDLAGLTNDTRRNPAGWPLDGYSLKPFLLDPDTTEWEGPDSALTVMGLGTEKDLRKRSYSLRSPDWRYVLYQNGDEELYYEADDPYEWTNLAAQAEFRSTARSFRSQLEERLGFDPATNLTEHILFLQDFESESGFLTSSNAMGFGEPIQTDANGTASKGDLIVTNVLGSSRLASVSVGGAESAQFRILEINGQPKWDFAFDVAVGSMASEAVFRIDIYGNWMSDQIRLSTLGTDNVIWTSDGGNSVTNTFAFTANSNYVVKVSYDGSTIRLTIDDTVVLTDLVPDSTLDQLGIVIGNVTGSPGLCFDHFLLADRYMDTMLWLIDNGYPVDANLYADQPGGISLMEAYALNLDPANPSAAPLQTGLSSGGAAFQVEFYGEAAGAFYDAESSTNLLTQTWTPVPFSMFSGPDTNGNMTVNVPATNGNMFLRLIMGLE